MASSSHSPTPTAENPRIAAIRSLSFDAPLTSCSPRVAATRSPARLPLFPLPPPIESCGSSFGDASDDELPHSARRSIKRVRSFHGRSFLSRQSSFHGANSPFARPRAASSPARPPPVDVPDVLALQPSADAATRPPPIRTMASLEGWGWGGDADGRVSAASCASAVLAGHSSGSTPALRPPPELQGLVAPPPTPSARGFGRRGGFGGSGAAQSSVPAMSLVAPGLYVGDEYAAASLAGLRAAGVTHVLNCSALPNPHEGQSGPAYLQLGLLDNTSDLPRMQEALGQGVEFIAQAIANGGGVLVHCHRGISRSATLAIAYLVRQTQQPADIVFELMRAKRRIIDPNLGYLMALKEWERRVLPPAMLRARSNANSPARPITPGRPNTPGRPLTPGGGMRPLSRAG